MAKAMQRSLFLADLQKNIDEHCATVTELFAPLTDRALTWQPTNRRGGREWSILQCFDHLNLTFDYYQSKISRYLDAPSVQGDILYKPSFWGGIYMHFALNPRYTFPSPPAVVPVAQPDRRLVLDTYLANQETLLTLLSTAATLDLSQIKVPIEKFVRFNLGDCLRVMVYHDGLHIDQAQRVHAEIVAKE